MSAFNTTYNYNMPNMNFGQAIGYGLLGSLTGGMGMGGCFGGGFGSPFSMGGSLFSMMGCGGLGNMYGSPASFFGMGCYSDQMAGAQLGFIGVNLVTGLIGKAIEGRGSAKAEREEKNAKLEEAKKTLNITEIQDVSTKNFESSTTYNTYNTKIANAINNAKSSNAPTKDPSTLEVKQVEKDGVLQKEYTYNNNTYADKELANKAKQEDIKNYKLNKALDSIKTPYSSDDANLNSADIPNDIQNTIKAAIKAKEDAEAKFNEAKDLVQAVYKQQQEERINAADGNSWSRTSWSKLQDKISLNNDENKYQVNADAKFDENDLQGILARYRKNPENKKQCKKMLKDLAENTYIKDIMRKSKYCSIIQNDIGINLK